MTPPVPRSRRPCLLLIPLLVITVLAVAALAFAGPATVQGTPNARADDPGALLERSAAELAADRPAAAEQLYRRVLAVAPGVIDAHQGLGRALAAQGRSAEAAAVLGRLGDGLLAAAQYEPAATALSDAVALAPESAELRTSFGRALIFLDRYAAAARELDRAVELGGSSPRLLLYLGSALWESGEIERAEQVLRRAAGGGGAAAAGVGLLARHQLGQLVLWQGRYPEAIELLEPVVAGSPAAVDPQLDLARALEGAERFEDALAAYRRVLALGPDRFQARYSMARVLARLGRRDEAAAEMAAYRAAYRQDQERQREEGLARARLDGAWQLLEEGDQAAAAERFAALGDNVEALTGLALARSATGDHAAAAAALERAVTLEPQRQDLRLMLAEERLAASGEGS